MSSVINNQTNENDQAINVPPRGQTVLSKGELCSTSLGVMTMTASQMLESFGVQTPNSGNSTNNEFFQDDLMTQMMLNDQKHRLEKGERMEEAFIRALGSELLDPKKKADGAPIPKQASTSKGKSLQETLDFLKSGALSGKSGAVNGHEYSGQNAIFEASGLLSKLQKNAHDSLIQQLQDDLKQMELQLQILEKLAQFIAQYDKALKKYEQNPTKENFDALIALLKDHYSGDPAMLKKLDELVKARQDAVNKQHEWDKKSGFEKWWDNLTGQNQDERYAMDRFNAGALGEFDQIEVQVFAGKPGLYTAFMQNGQKAFNDRIKQVLSQMTEIVMLIAILDGKGKNAIFKAEALLMGLMETALKNNFDKNKNQTSMAKINIQIQKDNYKKLEDNIKQIEKSEHKSHGIFGWIKDLVTSIVDVVVNIVTDICTGDFKGLYNDTVKGLVDSVKDAISDFAKGDILGGLEKLGTDVALMVLFGPAGLLLINSSFGKDIGEAVKLVADIVVAYYSILLAGIAYLGTAGQDMDLVNKLVDSAKTHGEAILSNPALQAVADIAMIVIIVASVISQQYWLAGIMIVLLVMNDATDSDGNSLMSDVTTGIAKGIQFLSGGTLSDDTAKWIADVFVIVVVALMTFGAGAAPAVADSTAEEGIEMVEMSSDIAAEGASEGADGIGQVAEDSAEQLKTAKQVSTGQKIGEFFKGVGESIGSRAGTTMMVTGMMAGATGFNADFAKAMEKLVGKDWARAIEYILMALEIIGSLAGGLGAASGEISAIDQQIGSALKKVVPKLINYIESNAATLTSAASQMMTGAMITQGTTNILQSADMILVGIIQKEMKQIEGHIAIMDAAEKLNQQMMKSNQSDLKKITEEEIQFVKNMNAPALASLGNAHALEQLA